MSRLGYLEGGRARAHQGRHVERRFSEPGFPWIGLVRVIGVGLGGFLTGHATDEPGVAAKQLVQAFEQSLADSLGPPPPCQDAAVHARFHMANPYTFLPPPPTHSPTATTTT